LMKGDAEKVKGLVQEKLKDGTSPFEILNNALIAGMTEVGKKFKALEIYVPEVLVSARAMSWGVDALSVCETLTYQNVASFPHLSFLHRSIVS